MKHFIISGMRNLNWIKFEVGLVGFQAGLHNKTHSVFRSCVHFNPVWQN